MFHSNVNRLISINQKEYSHRFINWGKSFGMANNYVPPINQFAPFINEITLSIMNFLTVNLGTALYNVHVLNQGLNRYQVLIFYDTFLFQKFSFLIFKPTQFAQGKLWIYKLVITYRVQTICRYSSICQVNKDIPFILDSFRPCAARVINILFGLSIKALLFFCSH